MQHKPHIRITIFIHYFRSSSLRCLIQRLDWLNRLAIRSLNLINENHVALCMMFKTLRSPNTTSEWVDQHIHAHDGEARLYGLLLLLKIPERDSDGFEGAGVCDGCVFCGSSFVAFPVLVEFSEGTRRLWTAAIVCASFFDTNLVKHLLRLIGPRLPFSFILAMTWCASFNRALSFRDRQQTNTAQCARPHVRPNLHKG